MLVFNKRNIIIKIILMIFLLILLCNNKSLATVKPTTSFYVNDYAGLLDAETASYIISTNKALNSKTGAQIVVVTVPNLEGQSLEEYATELFRSFGIGDKTKNNGVLLLLALEERQFRIEVGYGLEGRLTDAKTGRIQDEYIIPYLKQNDWNNGIKNGFSAIVKEVSEEYNVEIGEAQTPVTTTTSSNMEYWFAPMLINFVLGITIGILIRIKKIKGKTLLIGFPIYALLGIIILKIILQELSEVLSFTGTYFMMLLWGFIIGFAGGRRWLWRWLRRLFWRRFFRRWRRRLFFWRPAAHQEEEEAQEASSV